MSNANGTALAPTTVTPPTSLSRREEHNPLAFTPRGLDELFKFSERIAKSGLCPEKLREKPDDVAIVLMHGLELGLSPMQSLTEVYVVEGRPSISSRSAVALILRSGLAVYFDLTESTDKIATYKTLRKGKTKPTEISFRIEQAARKASFKKEGSNWQTNPEAMLRARAALALARVEYPDVVMGLIAREEIEDDEEPRDVTPVAKPMPPAVRVASAPRPSPAPTIESVATPRELTPAPVVVETPAETTTSFAAAALIDRAKAAALLTVGASAALDAIASDTNAAKRKGEIAPADLDAIKAAVQAARASLAAQAGA